MIELVVAGDRRMRWEGWGGGGVAGLVGGFKQVHQVQVHLALLLLLPLPSPGAGQHLLSIPRQPRTQSE